MSASAPPPSSMPRRTPLYDAHLGLGARMTPFGGYDMPLRLEAGLPLYGHELSPQRNAAQSGFTRAICLAKPFVGSHRIRDATPPDVTLAGIRFAGRRAAREGDEVFDGQAVTARGGRGLDKGRARPTTDEQRMERANGRTHAMTPEDRRYTRSHEWVKLDGDTALVGITDHAQEALGDITYVELPETEHTVATGEECAVIESVKAASDIFAPLAGEVIAVNAELANRPEIINEDPYGRGWIFKLGNVDADAYAHLMDASHYDATIEDDEE